MLLKKKDQSKEKPEIKVAYYGFICPICGSKIAKGANYLDHNGFKMCIKESN